MLVTFQVQSCLECRSWWWPWMYKDVIAYCRNCPDSVVVSGNGCKQVPPLHPIPVQHPFQIFGVELPVTNRGNWYVIVFQDFLPSGPWCSLHQTKRRTGLHALLLMRYFLCLGFQRAYCQIEVQICSQTL